ncbi:MAG: class I SAM-dependent methyltransferase [Candidatus Omnitrophota bacterium]
MIDDQKYWTERHRRYAGMARAVGQISYSEKANYYVYRIVLERYAELLGRLPLDGAISVLDAGCGNGVYTKFLSGFGFKVTAVDISQEAIDRLDIKITDKSRSSLETIPMPGRLYDIVHCFDVLYHILDDDEWKASIARLCALSGRYIILHERFLRRRPLISSPHIRQRPYSHTLSELRKNGFAECMSSPTHFWAMRAITYKITKHFPSFFYNLDAFILHLLDQFNAGWAGSHHIKVFVKRS